MKLRMKLVAGAATVALIGGLGFAPQTASAQTVPAPDATPTTTAPQTGTPLADVKDHKSLVGAKVKDYKGEAVGEVKSVKMGADGKIASVDVNVGDKTIALKADGLTYAQVGKTLTSKQSKTEIEQLPPS